MISSMAKTGLVLDPITSKPFSGHETVPIMLSLSKSEELREIINTSNLSDKDKKNIRVLMGEEQ